MLYAHRNRWSIVVLLITMFAGMMASRPAVTRAATDERFTEFWRQQGGLPIFGLPISDPTYQANADTGRSHLTQWYERNRFELHEENARPYDVFLGRLGVDRLEQLGRTWQRMPKAAPTASHYFVETGHAIAHEPFWRYWSSYGLE